MEKRYLPACPAPERGGRRWEGLLLLTGSLMLLLRVFAEQHNGIGGNPAAEILAVVARSGIFAVGIGIMAVESVLLAEEDELAPQLAKGAMTALTVLCGVLALREQDVSLLRPDDAEWLWLTSGKYRMMDWFCVLLFPCGLLLLKKTGDAALMIRGTLAMTAVQFWLFGQLPPVWVLWGAVLQFAAVGAALFAPENRPFEPLVSATLHGLYGLVWVLLLAIRYKGQSLRGLPGAEQWQEIRTLAQALLRDAGLLGCARTDTISAGLLNGAVRPLHTALFYGGWAAAAGYLLVLTVFCGAVLCLTVQGYRHHRPDWCVTFCAALHLLLRAVLGTLWQLGLSPLSVAAPFSGTWALLFDPVCLVLLLNGAGQRGWLDWLLDKVVEPALLRLYPDLPDEDWEEEEPSAAPENAGEHWKEGVFHAE